MAISKVGTYRNPPEDITDYQAIAAHLNAYTRQLGSQAMILTEWINTSGTPSIAMGSYISHGGVLYVVDSEEAVALPVSDGTYYLKVEASGDTLVLSWISNLSGYSWNAVHNGLYHADESQVLGYQLVVAGAVVEKWRLINVALGSASLRVNYLGSLRGTDFDQPLKTTDSPTFANATISGHNVDTQLDRINQDVKTTASPTFENLTTNKGIICEAFGTDSMTGDNIYDALYDRIKYPESGKRILLSGSFFLPNTNTQCIPITVAYYSSTNKYSIRYMMIGSKDNLLTIEVASGDSTVRITDAMIAIAGGKYTLPY